MLDMKKQQHILLYNCIEMLGDNLDALFEHQETSVYLAVCEEDVFRILRSVRIAVAVINVTGFDKALLVHLEDEFDTKFLYFCDPVTKSSFCDEEEDYSKKNIAERILNSIQQGD